MDGIQKTGLQSIQQTDANQPIGEKARTNADRTVPGDQADVSQAVATLLAYGTERVAELKGAVGSGTYSPEPAKVAAAIVSSSIRF